MPDQNDIVFSQQTVDVTAIFDAIASKLHSMTGGGVDIISVWNFFESAWGLLVIFLFLLGTLFLFGFIYASIRFNQLAETEMDIIFKQEELWQQLYGKGSVKNSRMDDIEQHISTENPNDWKLAIIEADIELGKILDKAGYVGGTIGEQLKSASVQAFETLDDAWEAHLVRNKIAHQGADFVLTHKLARDTITRYKRVFAEFSDLL